MIVPNVVMMPCGHRGCTNSASVVVGLAVPRRGIPQGPGARPIILRSSLLRCQACFGRVDAQELLRSRMDDNETMQQKLEGMLASKGVFGADFRRARTVPVKISERAKRW